MGWKNPFHPDDMAETSKRWAHSLATGDPYVTEYRCLSKEGEWRWHLGRALPLRNLETGKIEKWFGKLNYAKYNAKDELIIALVRREIVRHG